MIPVLYGSEERSFERMGLGALASATRCIVAEERNSKYELELDYPVAGRLFSSLLPGNVILAPHDGTGDLQPFDIIKVESPISGVCTVHARHVSYRLNGIICKPYTAATCAAAMQGLADNAINTCGFDFSTTKTTAANFTLMRPASIRQVIGGMDGSILDTYGGGELTWDRWTVKLAQHRGKDSTTEVRYGKNLLALDRVLDRDGVYNALVPYWVDGEDGHVVTLPEYIVYASGVTADTAIAQAMDCSTYWDTEPTAAQLRSKAQAYLAGNQPWVLKDSLEIDCVAPEDTLDWGGLYGSDPIRLCDYVQLVAPDVVARAECVGLEYDVLGEKISKLTLGQPKRTLTDAIVQAAQAKIMPQVRALMRR